jgi:hypothetical protein
VRIQAEIEPRKAIHHEVLCGLAEDLVQFVKALRGDLLNLQYPVLAVGVQVVQLPVVVQSHEGAKDPMEEQGQIPLDPEIVRLMLHNITMGEYQ